MGRATRLTASVCRKSFYFNPRPPWGGRLGSNACISSAVGISIHALRGEGDARDLERGSCSWHFNPRPPWGGRPVAQSVAAFASSFQSTPSVGRATMILSFLYLHCLLFQSTPSVGRATTYRLRKEKIFGISIHALRGEGDTQKPVYNIDRKYFNPRPPWGGRLSELENAPTAGEFQSTPSVGRATGGQGSR